MIRSVDVQTMALKIDVVKYDYADELRISKLIEMTNPKKKKNCFKIAHTTSIYGEIDVPGFLLKK